MAFEPTRSSARLRTGIEELGLEMRLDSFLFFPSQKLIRYSI